MQYLKLWVSFQKTVEEFTDEEVGRLLRMMLKYVETGEAPSSFVGNERYIWSAVQQMIDAAETKAEKLRQNGSKGGRPVTNGMQPEANESNDNQTKPNNNQTKPNKTLYVQDKDKVYVKDKDNTFFDRFWSAYPRKVGKENARKAFAKINQTEEMMQIILREIKRQSESPQWTKDGGQYIPHPATWLNGKRWEDEETTIKPKKSESFAQRDYSDVPAEMMNDLVKEMEVFKANGA